MIQPGMYYVVLSVYWDNLNEQGACSDGTSTTRAACEGTDPAGTWTTEASLRLPDALYLRVQGLLAKTDPTVRSSMLQSCQSTVRWCEVTENDHAREAR